MRLSNIGSVSLLASIFVAACGSDASDAGGSAGSASASAGASGAAVAGATSSAAGAVSGGAEGVAGAANGGSASGSGSTSAGGASAGGASAGTGGTATTTEKFSFFVTSWAGLQRLAKQQGLGDGSDGFGGDLRFGETGAGAGLRGADRICSTLAEASLPGASGKQWRAFLSAADDGTGKPVNAIDRIGTGPWYDRVGRLFGNAIADINMQRPANADAAIREDFPNEDGVPNHRPDPTQPAVDNHDMLTGSDSNGKLYAGNSHCVNWTSAIGNTATEGKPRVGHSWPRGTGDSANWKSSLTESGCKAGANLKEQGGPLKDAVTVGSGGGYGGFYCFALTP